MSFKKIFQNISSDFVKNKESFATLFVAIPGAFIGAIVEYNEAGLSPYFIKNIGYIAIMIICLLLYKFFNLGKRNVFTVPVYVIVLGEMISVIFRIQNPEVHFEASFLKAEIVLTLMMFGVGMMVHYKHIIILLSINILFMLICCNMEPSYPVEKFCFYGFIVTLGSMVAFFSQRMLVGIYRKLKEANNIIKIKNEELREMNKSKDKLFRIIGHDLRTPFHQLSSLVDMINETECKNEEAEFKALLKESADKGNQLLEDLLKWSSSYKLTSDIELKKQDISEMVERVFEFSNLKRKTKEIGIINKLEQNLKININTTMMETVLRNLIANSIKFSHRGSNITVKSEKIDNLVKIAIIDQGIGICKYRMSNLFVKNKNESTFGTENESGTGFGLSIAKELVEKQNGTFEVKSERNKGTTINMYFPLGQIA